MNEQVELDSLSIIERVVLLGIVDAVVSDEDPIDSHELKARVETQVEQVETTVLGDPAERDIMRALNAIGGEAYINEQLTHSSPTGKGRPRYTLDVEPVSVLDALDDDDRLTALIATIEE